MKVGYLYFLSQWVPQPRSHINSMSPCMSCVAVCVCYDLGSSLHKRNDLQGKDGLTSILRYLTNGSVWTDAEDYVGRTRMGGFKGQPLMVAAEAGVENTGSNSYR